jgi:type I restriction enzyme, S subunit
MSTTKELPQGWDKITLESFVEICDELRSPVNVDERAGRIGPYPYFGATGQVGWIDDYLMDGEYVLLGEDGAPFLDPIKTKAYIVSGKCWVNNHAHVLKCFEGLGNNKYLMYFLNAFDYREVVNGTTRLKLTQSAMRQIPILVPPLPEQQRIVATIEQQFSRIDAVITSLQHAKAKLIRQRAAILKAAVEGTLTEGWRAQQPASETAEQQLQRILNERRAKWEDEHLAKMQGKGVMPKDDKWKDAYKEPGPPDTRNLPELPKEWIWASMGQISQIQGGIQKQPSRTPRNNAYPYLRVANVFRGRLDLSVIEKMELFGNELDTLRLEIGDLLIVEGNGSRSEIGRSALWHGEIQDCVHQNHIIRVRLQHIIPSYIDYYWNSPDGNNRVMEVAASTSGLYTLSISKIAKLPIPLPPLVEQQRIVSEIEQRLSIIAQSEVIIEANLIRADRMRLSILNEAFEGRLVPQDPKEEPASILLERIKEERVKREREDRQRRKEVAMSKSQDAKMKKAIAMERRPLHQILIEANRPVTPVDLFNKAGLKADAVEAFYEELRKEVVEGRIREVRPDDTRVYLEAVIK